MFAHVQIGASDLSRMCAFDDRVLIHFGLQRTVPACDCGMRRTSMPRTAATRKGTSSASSTRLQWSAESTRKKA